MLNAGQLRFTAGRVRNSTTVDPSVTVNGTPITSTNLLSLSNGAASVFSSGLPYSATGRLAVDIGGTPASISQAIAFTSAGRVVADTVGAIAGYVGGVPVTATGALALAAAE